MDCICDGYRCMQFCLFIGLWCNVIKSIYFIVRFVMVYGLSNDFFYIVIGEGGNRDYYNDIWKFDIRFVF